MLKYCGFRDLANLNIEIYKSKLGVNYRNEICCRTDVGNDDDQFFLKMHVLVVDYAKF